MASLFAGLMVLLLWGPGVAPALAQSVDSKPATPTIPDQPSKAESAPKASPNLDLAAVEGFFKALDATMKTAAESSSSEEYGFERGEWWLPRTWCETKLGLSKDDPIETCQVLDISSRRAAVVIVIKACEAEHCDVDYWILSDRSGLRPSPISLDFAPVVSPDSKYLYAGHTGMGPEMNGYTAYLRRVTLDTLETEQVAECAAPTLSPSERWVVCRDASGHVHRMPVNGGPLERVHTIDLGKDVIYSDPHIGVNLPPVQFIKKNRMRIVTLTAGDEEDVEEAKWVDGPFKPTAK